MKTPLLATTIALTFVACNDSVSPTSPTPAPIVVTNWLVTQRFVSVNGPDNCWVREQRARWTGAVFPSLPMTVTRTGSSIRLDGEFFQVNYAGTVIGNQFSTNGIAPLDGGGGRCQDGTSFPQSPGASHLSGRFSGDQLSATEVNTYSLSSGATVIYTWDWQATRLNAGVRVASPSR